MSKIYYPEDVDNELERMFNSGKLYHYLPGGKKEGQAVFDKPVSSPIKGRKSYSSMINTILPWRNRWEISRLCQHDIIWGTHWLQSDKKGIYSVYKRIQITSPAEVFRYIHKEQDLQTFLRYINEYHFPKELKPLMYEVPSFREWVYGLSQFAQKIILEQKTKEWIASEILHGIIVRCQNVPDKKEFARNVFIPYLDTKFLERNMGKIRQVYNAVNDAPATNKEDLAEKLNIQFGIPVFTVFRNGEIINLEETQMNEYFDKNPPHTLLLSENNVPVRSHDYKDIVVIGGMGYRVVELIQNMKWISRVKNVYYWGDMDKNGFNILNRVYDVLPRVQSVLMDVETIKNIFLDVMVKDVERTYDEANYKNLFSSEYNAFEYLKEHDLRIEQEHIPENVVQKMIDHISNNL